MKLKQNHCYGHTPQIQKGAKTSNSGVERMPFVTVVVADVVVVVMMTMMVKMNVMVMMNVVNMMRVIVIIVGDF